MKTTISIALALIVGCAAGWFYRSLVHESEVEDFIDEYHANLERENQMVALMALRAIRQIRGDRISDAQNGLIQHVAFFYAMYGPPEEHPESISEETLVTLEAIKREISLNSQLKEAIDVEISKDLEANPEGSFERSLE